jgi:hypothetical protein
MNVFLPSDFNGKIFNNNKINKIQLVFIVCGVLSLLYIGFSYSDTTKGELIAYMVGCIYATIYLVCFFSVDREFLLKRRNKNNVNKNVIELTTYNNGETK